MINQLTWTFLAESEGSPLPRKDQDLKQSVSARLIPTPVPSCESTGQEFGTMEMSELRTSQQSEMSISLQEATLANHSQWLGQGGGADDDRHLWPSMFELVKTFWPNACVFENVLGHITLGLDEVLFDLESIGYSAQPFAVSASAIDAPHERFRIWIVAYAPGERWNVLGKDGFAQCEAINSRLLEGWWNDPNNLCLDVEGLFPDDGSGQSRNDDGLSEGVDRLRCIGNSICPDVAQRFTDAIYKTLTTQVSS